MSGDTRGTSAAIAAAMHTPRVFWLLAFIVPAAGCIFPTPDPWKPGFWIKCNNVQSALECVDKQDLADNPWLAEAACDLACTQADCPGSVPASVELWEQCTPGFDVLEKVLAEGIGPLPGRWQCETHAQVAIGVNGVFDPMVGEWYPFPVDEPAGAIEVCANGFSEAATACWVACQDEVTQWSAAYPGDLLFRRPLNHEPIASWQACQPLKLPRVVGTCEPFVPGLADAVMSQGDSVEVLEASGDYTVAPGDAALRPIGLHNLTLKRGVISVQTALGPVVAEDVVVRLARPAFGKLIDGRSVILPASGIELFLAGRVVDEQDGGRERSEYEAYTGVLQGDVHGELTDRGLVLHLDEIPYLPGLRLDVRIAAPARSASSQSEPEHVPSRP
jgi:hypothetical protein